MKKHWFPLIVLLAACSLQADDKLSEAPEYVNEAPLPENWPAPGPYNEVAEKAYPSYRAAFTNGKGERGAFWTLFMHIKKNQIPMTAPVEMAMADDEGKLERKGMAFLYQNGKVGTAGSAGAKVEVRDVPGAKALSYAWQGPDSKQNVALAREALEAVIETRGLETQGFRMLGYNGPGTPRDKKTWELQALLK